MRRTQKVVHRYEREITHVGIRNFNKMVEVYRRFLTSQLIPGRRKSGFFDADEPELERLRRMIVTLTEQNQRINRPEMERALRGIFQQMDRRALEDMQRAIGAETSGAIFNSNIDAIIRRSVDDVATNFRFSEQRTASNVTARLTSGLVAGERHESIAEDIASSLGLQGDERKAAKARARFIARNTASKVLGELNKERQTASGIPLYMWQTAEDERVRPTHEDLNGKVFSWNGTIEVRGKTYEQASDPGFNDGAPTIPGQPWNCRCVGLAYIPELEE